MSQEEVIYPTKTPLLGLLSEPEIPDFFHFWPKERQCRVCVFACVCPSVRVGHYSKEQERSQERA